MCWQWTLCIDNVSEEKPDGFGEAAMLHNIIIGLGALFSAFLGYIVFQASGLCSSCESILLKYIVGFALAAAYIIAFKSGVVNNNARQKYLM